MKKLLLSMSTLLLSVAVQAQGVRRSQTPAMDKPRPAIDALSRTLVASLPFSGVGCWPSGSVIGGKVITFARVGTKTCLGVGTCQANQLCVDANGAYLGSGETLSIPFPFSTVPTAWSIEASYTPDGAWAGDWILWTAGAVGAANTALVDAYSSGTMYTQFRDSGAGLHNVSYPFAFASGSFQRIGATYVSGAPSAYIGGAFFAGPGTTGAWSSMPTTLTIGSDGAGTRQFVGHVRDLKVYSNASFR